MFRKGRVLAYEAMAMRFGEPLTLGACIRLVMTTETPNFDWPT